MPKTRSDKQIYIAMFEDSPRIENLVHPMVSENFFNWTMTYRSDSDIPNPYGRIVSHEYFSPREKQMIGSNIDLMIDDMERNDFQIENKKRYHP